MRWRHPPRPEKEKDETKETKSKEKRSQVLDKETEKEAKRGKNHQKKETNLRDRIFRQQTLPLSSLETRDTAR